MVIPTLPVHFVERAEMKSLIERLLSAGSRTLALQGRSGLGKTTLALALMQQPEIKTRFEDGVLWANLGPAADTIEAWQVAWGRALDDDLAACSDLPTKTARLQELLADKSCLVVIDDLWPEVDLAPLLVGGAQCRTLITTRHSGAAQHAGATLLTIEPLREAESLALLSHWAGGDLPAEAAALARRLDHLPLALALLGTQLQAGAAGADLLATLPAGEGEQNLDRLLDLCFDRLAAADQARLAQLALFAPDKPFTVAAAGAVWDDSAAAERLERFSRAAFLRATPAGYLLHARLRAYLWERLSPEQQQEAATRHTAHYLQIARDGSDIWPVLGQVESVWRRLHRAEEAQLFALIEAMQPVWSRWGLWQTALAWEQTGLTLARHREDQPRQITSLNNLGYTYYLLGKGEEALDCFQQALDLARLLDQPDQMAVLCHNMGQLYQSYHDQDSALSYFQQALTLYRALADEAGIAAVLTEIGQLYYSRDRLNLALHAFRQALALVDDEEGRTFLHDKIGQIYYNQGDLDRALAQFQEALALVDDAENFGQILTNIGQIQSEQGEPEAALDSYRQALARFEAIGHKSKIALVLGNIGQVYAGQGQLDLALEQYQRALEIERTTGDKAGLSRILTNLGQLHLSRREPQTALQLYQEALEHCEAIADKAGQAVLLSNIGQIHQQAGAVDLAFEHYRQAFAINRLLGNKAGMAGDLNNLGQFHSLQGDLEPALHYYQQALAYFQALEDKPAQAILHNNIAGIYQDQGRPFLALDHFQQALVLNRSVGNKEHTGVTLINIIILCMDQRWMAEANIALKKLSDFFDAVDNDTGYVVAQWLQEMRKRDN